MSMPWPWPDPNPYDVVRGLDFSKDERGAHAGLTGLAAHTAAAAAAVECREMFTRKCPPSGCSGLPCARFEDDDESRWPAAGQWPDQTAAPVDEPPPSDVS